MIIEVNEDLEKYKETIVFGLTAKQTVYSALALISGSVVVFLSYKHVGMNVSCYLAMPAVIPFGLQGFYKKNGMSFTEMFGSYLQLTFKNRVLCYESTEEPKIRKVKKNKKAENKRK